MRFEHHFIITQGPRANHFKVVHNAPSMFSRAGSTLAVYEVAPHPHIISNQLELDCIMEKLKQARSAALKRAGFDKDTLSRFYRSDITSPTRTVLDLYRAVQNKAVEWVRQ